MPIDQKTKMLYLAMTQMMSPEAVAAMAGAVDRLKETDISGQEIADLIADTGNVEYKDGKPISINLNSFGDASVIYDGSNKDEFITTLKAQSQEGYDVGADYEEVSETGKSKTRMIAASLAGLVALVVASPAYATLVSPSMEIFDATSQGEWNDSNPGNELKVAYLVTNTSEDDDIYEMNKLVIAAGENQGVYDAVAPTDWTFNIDLDETIFNTTSPSAYIDPVNGQGFFELYSTILDVGQRDAIAYTIANPPEQFNPVPVDVPVPEPSTMAILGLGLAGLLAKNYRRENSPNE